jgi:hypothetical protein
LIYGIYGRSNEKDHWRYWATCTLKEQGIGQAKHMAQLGRFRTVAAFERPAANMPNWLPPEEKPIAEFKDVMVDGSEYFSDEE